MEEEKAHRLYQDLQAAGSGAARFKQGLGYGQGARPPAPSQASTPTAPSLPPASAGKPASAQPPYSPAGQPPAAAHPAPLLPLPVPGHRPPHAFHPPPPPGARPHSFPAPPAHMMPPRGPPPPGYRPPYPMPPGPYMGGPPPPGFRPPPPGGFPPPPGYGRPPYPLPPRPTPHYFPGPQQQQQQHPFPGQPYLAGPPYPQVPHPPSQGQQDGVAVAVQSAPSKGEAAQQVVLQEEKERQAEELHQQAERQRQQREAEQAQRREELERQRQQREAEEQRKREEAAAASAAEAEAKRRQAEASAWAAYKSDDGTVYFYNTLTGQSSWERPEGFEGDAEKASAQPVPVSSEKVAGTDWLEVVCDDGKKYYYNNRSGETSWQVPLEVEAKARVKLDPAKAAMLERVKAAGATIAPEYQAALEEEEESGGQGGEDVSFTEDDVAPPAPNSHSGHPAGAGAAPAPRWSGPPPPAVPSARAAQQQPKFDPRFGMLPAVPPPLRPKGTGFGPDGFWPRERAVTAFKELLSDKGIHAFSRWEREVPKLQPDLRFKYVPASERRGVFEEFCKEVAASRSKAASGGARPAGSKASGAGQAASIHAGAEEVEAEAEGSGQQAQQRGETGFIALLLEIHEACCSTQQARPGGANGASADGEGGSEAGELAPEGGPSRHWCAGLTLEQLEPMWGSDPRWQRCGPELRQQLFAAQQKEFEAAAQREVEEGYRALLKEQGVGPGSRWSKTKDSLRDDPRYKAVARGQREALFRQYVAQLQAVEDDERAKRAQREEREREAQRKLEAERRAAEQRQKQAAHSDAVTNYRALLTELVRDCDATWREMQPRLAKDPQGRGPNNPALERGEAEKLFRDHVQDLLDAANEAFLDLLDATLQPLMPTKSEQDLSGLPMPLLRFKDAVKLLDSDPRFHRLPADVREVRWRRYVDDILFNRDYPSARPRTQRRPKREGGLHLGAGREEGGPPSGRRPREEVGASGGMDKAYAREYFQPDRKRARQD